MLVLVLIGMLLCEKMVQSMQTQIEMQMGRCVWAWIDVKMRVLVRRWVNLSVRGGGASAREGRGGGDWGEQGDSDVNIWVGNVAAAGERKKSLLYIETYTIEKQAGSLDKRSRVDVLKKGMAVSVAFYTCWSKLDGV